MSPLSNATNREWSRSKSVRLPLSLPPLPQMQSDSTATYVKRMSHQAGLRSLISDQMALSAWVMCNLTLSSPTLRASTTTMMSSPKSQLKRRRSMSSSSNCNLPMLNCVSVLRSLRGSLWRPKTRWLTSCRVSIWSPASPATLSKAIRSGLMQPIVSRKSMKVSLRMYLNARTQPKANSWEAWKKSTVDKAASKVSYWSRVKSLSLSQGWLSILRFLRKSPSKKTLTVLTVIAPKLLSHNVT